MKIVSKSLTLHLVRLQETVKRTDKVKIYVCFLFICCNKYTYVLYIFRTVHRAVCV